MRVQNLVIQEAVPLEIGHSQDVPLVWNLSASCSTVASGAADFTFCKYSGMIRELFRT